jgi:poly(A) polymerase/tRNA nucleotidyltransferase (CCA-adding enzyme)
MWKPHPAPFQALLETLAQETDPVYVVGGVIRDYLLARPTGAQDLDVVVAHSAIPVARRVADRLGWAFYPLDGERDVARLIFTAASTPLVCDMASMRGDSIETDLLARDFTANALAVRWRGRSSAEMVDVTGGRADVELRLLRRVSPTSLVEDPVRLLRAIRLAVQLDFSIEPETLAQIVRMADTVRLASPERVRDELWRMLLAARPDQGIQLLREHGLLRPLLPEIADLEGVEQSAPHDTDVLEHTLRVVRTAAELRDWLCGRENPAPKASEAAAKQWRDSLTPWLYRLRQHFLTVVAGSRRRVEWLPWLALWHDVGKPAVRTKEEFPAGRTRYRFIGHEELSARMAAARLEQLRFSRQEIDLTFAVEAAHMRPHALHTSFGADPISRRALYRYFRETDARLSDSLAGVDTALLALADYQGIYRASPPPEWVEYLRHIDQFLDYAFSEQGLAQARRPLVDGHTLMQQFNLPPGPRLGELLGQLQEAQAAGEVHTAEDALLLVGEWLDATGRGG